MPSAISCFIVMPRAFAADIRAVTVLWRIRRLSVVGRSGISSCIGGRDGAWLATARRASSADGRGRGFSVFIGRSRDVKVGLQRYGGTEVRTDGVALGGTWNPPARAKFGYKGCYLSSGGARGRNPAGVGQF